MNRTSFLEQMNYLAQQIEQQYTELLPILRDENQRRALLNQMMLQGDYPLYKTLKQTVSKETSYRVSELTVEELFAKFKVTVEAIDSSKIKGKVLGACMGWDIYVAKDIDERMQCHVFTHEMAHGVLDHPLMKSLSTVEIEAETVAYLFGIQHGLDTTSWTVPYLIRFGDDEVFSLLKTQQEDIYRGICMVNRLFKDIHLQSVS